MKITLTSVWLGELEVGNASLRIGGDLCSPNWLGAIRVKEIMRRRIH